MRSGAHEHGVLICSDSKAGFGKRIASIYRVPETRGIAIDKI
jgi:hypothetical protein